MRRSTLERWRYVLPLRLRSLVRGDAVDRELDEELRDHLERSTRHGVERGLSEEAARAAALRAFGGLAQRKDECRDTRRVALVEDLVKDVRYAARILRRTRAFTAVAVLSLALGIGANTAIFHLLDAIRLRPLPVPAAHELAIVTITNWNWPRGNYSGRYASFTYPLWTRIHDSQQAFAELSAWGNATLDLATRGESRFAENALWVSGNFFTMLRVPPALGRVFSTADDRCESPGVVLSHGLWQREFGGAPSAIGRTLSINDHPFEIVGVTPAWFFGVDVGRSYDFALPICAEPILYGSRSRIERRADWWLSAIGRLKPGWSVEQASAHLASISAPAFRQTLPATYDADAAREYLAFTLGAVPGASGLSNLRQQYDAPLWLLLGVAGMVLLIACANLANLMLARASVREREVAVRLALGASRGRVIRQWLTESLLIASLGAAGAALLAPILGRSVIGLISTPVNPLFVDVRTDWRVLAFTASLALLACLVFGLVPALRVTRTAAAGSIQSGVRGLTGGGPRLAVRRALVAAQVALSLVLLVGGLLFARSLYNLLRVDAGFTAGGILEADVDLSRLGLPAERRGVVVEDLMARIAAAPGVQSVAAASTIPLVGRWNGVVYVDTPSGPRQGVSQFNRVSAAYFATLRTPIVAGRAFDDRDRASEAKVAIVNDAFVRQMLDGVRPLGRRFRVESAPGAPERWYEIVGVAANTKYTSLRDPFAPIVYLAALQDPRLYPANILIRSGAPLGTLQPAIKQVLERANPALVFHFHDFEEEVHDSLLEDRLLATLCGFFAVLAAVLATVGVYGVISYLVVQRTNEIGLRLALGAGERAILAMVFGESARVLAIGIAAGVALSLALPGAAGAKLFGLAPRDPMTIAAAIVLLASAAAVASLLPARRAARIDPVTALRCD